MSATEKVPKNWVVKSRYPALAILVFGAVGVFFYIYLGLADNRTLQTMWKYGAVSGTVLFSFLWWSIFAPISRKTWKKSMVALAVFSVAFNVIFKFDGWDGSMWPQFTWRWKSYDEPDAAYFADLAEKDSSVASQELKSSIDERKSQIASSNNPDSIDFSLSTPDEIWSSQIHPDRASLENIDGYSLALGSHSRNIFREVKLSSPGINWPMFRGPRMDGIVQNQSIQTDWSNSQPEQLWHQQMGKGSSSFAVVNGMAFTQEQRHEMECVVCYDVETGKQVWVHEDKTRWEDAQGGDGPRSTPTVVGRRVYTVGATGYLNCLDVLTGSKEWQIRLLENGKADNLAWGISCSPLVCGNLVILNYGRFSGQKVAAYDRFTGAVVWEVDGDPSSYASPLLKTILGKQQLLIFSGIGLVSYDPNDGTKLWRTKKFENDYLVNAALPIVVENQILISSGYGVGAAMYEINYQDGRWEPLQVWRTRNKFRLKFNDAVYKDGYVYGLDDSFLACLEFKTGKIKWKMREKFGYGQVLLVGENLLVSSEYGEVALLRATPKKPKVTARFQALDEEIGGITWNQHVLYRGLLLVRNNRQAACYDLRLTKTVAESND